MTDTHSTILGLWPSLQDVASDVGAKEARARKWKARDSIPAEFWSALVEAAKRRGIDGVTLERLAAIAAAKRSSQAAE